MGAGKGGKRTNSQWTGRGRSPNKNWWENKKGDWKEGENKAWRQDDKGDGGWRKNDGWGTWNTNKDAWREQDNKRVKDCDNEHVPAKHQKGEPGEPCQERALRGTNPDSPNLGPADNNIAKFSNETQGKYVAPSCPAGNTRVGCGIGQGHNIMVVPMNDDLTASVLSETSIEIKLTPGYALKTLAKQHAGKLREQWEGGQLLQYRVNQEGSFMPMFNGAHLELEKLFTPMAMMEVEGWKAAGLKPTDVPTEDKPITSTQSNKNLIWLVRVPISLFELMQRISNLAVHELLLFTWKNESLLFYLAVSEVHRRFPGVKTEGEVGDIVHLSSDISSGFTPFTFEEVKKYLSTIAECRAKYAEASKAPPAPSASEAGHTGFTDIFMKLKNDMMSDTKACIAMQMEAQNKALAKVLKESREEMDAQMKMFVQNTGNTPGGSSSRVSRAPPAGGQAISVVPGSVIPLPAGDAKGDDSDVILIGDTRASVSAPVEPESMRRARALAALEELDIEELEMRAARAQFLSVASDP